jgi:hypothetical protein
MGYYDPGQTEAENRKLKIEVKRLRKLFKLINTAFPEDVIEDQMGEDIIKYDNLRKKLKI